MTKKCWRRVAVTLGMIAIHAAANACTRVVYEAEDPATAIKFLVVGRTMDWKEDIDATGVELYQLPRGLERVGSTQSNPLRWTSRYSSFVSYFYGTGAVDGVNERGLMGNLLFLKDSNYGQRQPGQPGLAVSLWLQYALDSFATVGEALDQLSSPSFHLILTEAGKAFSAISLAHLSLTDTTGDCAIIEYVGGHPHVYHNRLLRVLSNSPPFDEQLEKLLEFWADQTDDIPGTTDSTARFIRAAYYLVRLPQTATPLQALTGLRTLMQNVAEPAIVPRSASEPSVSPTIWASVLDQTHGRYYLQVTSRLNSVFVDCPRLPEGQILRLSLSIDQPDFLDNVTGLFRPSSLPPYAKELPDIPPSPSSSESGDACTEMVDKVLDLLL